jgi:hypothetical protein
MVALATVPIAFKAFIIAHPTPTGRIASLVAMVDLAQN